MVAKAWGDRIGARKSRPSGRVPKRHPSARGESAIEERFVRNDAVSLRLLLNRRTKTMRIIDLRAGPSHAKRLFVRDLAKREGIEKLFTLVERDEVSTWLTLGFTKEASVPGFYKRSDAFLLGSELDEPSPPTDDGLPEGAREEAPSPKTTAAHELADKTLAHAKRQAKSLLDRPLPVVKITRVTAADVQKPLDKAVRAGRALTTFEPFGRDVDRRYFVLTSRGGFELVASTESQPCFGNVFLELLTAPATELERLATVAALGAMCDALLAEGVVSCFSLTPSDDAGLATAFVWSGFRRTGLLVGHLLVGRERKDAIVWSRKLATPSDA